MFRIKKLVQVLLFISGVFLLTGCIDKYSPPSTNVVVDHSRVITEPTKNETFVYVIRKRNMVGAILSSYVDVNETLIELNSGEYIKYTLKDDINTLSIYDEIITLFYARPTDYPKYKSSIDYNKGQNIFLLIDIVIGGNSELKFIDKEEGLSYITSTDYHYAKTVSTASRISGRELLALNPVDLMLNNVDNMKVKEGNAKIIFYRNGDNGQGSPGIWTENEFIGAMINESYIEVDVTEGKHMFYTKYGSWGILEANVIAGKTYFVELDSNVGWNNIYSALIPKEGTLELKDKVLALQRIEINKVKVDDIKIKARINTAYPYIENFINNQSKHTISSEEVLKVESGLKL